MPGPKPTEKAEALRLFADGVKVEEIGRRLGVHPQSVKKWAGRGRWQALRDDRKAAKGEALVGAEVLVTEKLREQAQKIGAAMMFRGASGIKTVPVETAQDVATLAKTGAQIAGVMPAAPVATVNVGVGVRVGMSDGMRAARALAEAVRRGYMTRAQAVEIAGVEAEEVKP